MRVVDKRVGEAQSLLHPRDSADVRVALRPEVHQLEEIADDPPAAVGRDPVAAREEVQVLPDLHVVVDPERVRHEPDDAAHVVGVPPDGGTRDLGVPRSGTSSVARMRSVVVLPAPFGPTSPKTPLGDIEVEAGHRERPVVSLDETGGVHDAGHRIVPLISIGSWKPTCCWPSSTNLTRTSPVAGSTQRFASGSS